MTQQSPILLAKPHDGVCLLTLNRPEKRNALDGSLIQEWTRVLQNLAQDASVRIVMLNGNGKHFCAGADIAWMQKMSQCTRAENVEDALQLARLLKIIDTFPKPVIGLLHGAVMGGGLGVIACCDMVVAADDAVFCFSEAKMGLTPSVISPYVIPVMGERAARYYFLTAEKFNVQIAVALKLVQQVVPLEKLFDTGLLLAKTLLNNSQNALIEAKKIIRRMTNHDVSAEMMQMTAEHLAAMRASPDAQEGLRAFLEKRLPIWE